MVATWEQDEFKVTEKKKVGKKRVVNPAPERGAY